MWRETTQNTPRVLQTFFCWRVSSAALLKSKIPNKEYFGIPFRGVGGWEDKNQGRILNRRCVQHTSAILCLYREFNWKPKPEVRQS